MNLAWKLMGQLAQSTLWQKQKTLPLKGGERVNSLKLSPDYALMGIHNPSSSGAFQNK